MAESTNHLDVEDVLSSIRRLVADGPIKTARKSTAAPLFVLTPAHRVSGDAIGASGELQHGFDEASLHSGSKPKDVAEEVEPQKKPEPLVLSQPALPDSDAEDQAVDRPMLLTERVTAEDDASVQFEEPEHEPGDSLAATEDARHLLETRIAELERAVGRVEDEWEPDGSEPQEQHQPKLQFLKRYRDRFEVIDGDGADMNDPAQANPPANVQADTARQEAVPAEGATFSHRPHPGDVAPSDVPEPATSAGTVVDQHDDFFVDEEVLRSMVSDIVRQELQGRLGERITRNVRRMVRHEIEKALSLKALE